GHAAALTSRDFSLGAPKWCYAPDRIPHPVVKKAAGQVGMIQPVGPGMDIGEGCASMHALPGLQATLRLINELPYLPPEEPEEAVDGGEPVSRTPQPDEADDTTETNEDES